MDNFKIVLQENETFGLKTSGNDTFKLESNGSNMPICYNDLLDKPIHVDTVENWNANKSFIGERGHIYVYSNYQNVGGADIPAVKISDGKAYLIDTPFIDGNRIELEKHINDKSAHITDIERIKWNNGLTCYMSENENLKFEGGE